MRTEITKKPSSWNRRRRIRFPADSEVVATGEAAKKYDKVIEKGSRVLERFPDNDRQTARAVFLIGESFRHKGEWAKAVAKMMNSNGIFPTTIPCRKWNTNGPIACIGTASTT